MNILQESYIAYINLDSRPDRDEHMQKELTRIGIKAKRRRAFLPDQYTSPKYEVMRRRTPGAIGCHLSQRALMVQANFMDKNAWIMEDDLVFCDDFKDRLTVIENFLVNNDEWDIFWFGGTYHTEPTWHKNPHPQDMKHCHCTLNRDYEETYNERIRRTYGAFSTHCYLVNRDSITKVIGLLDENVHLSQGIDHNFIFLQPQLKTFAFNPGCVIQYDNQSNIGNGMTYFSGFEKLGPHWFKNKI